MFDDIIKDKANSHEAPVPPDAWNNIVKQKKKRRVGFFWWSSMLLLLCGLAVTGYFISRKQNGNNVAAGTEKLVAHADKKGSSATITATTQEGINTIIPNAVSNNGNDNNRPLATSDQSKNNTIEIPGNNIIADDLSEPTTNDKQPLKNNRQLFAGNGFNKKKIKGRANYNSSGSKPEEINSTAIAEKKNTGTGSTGIDAEEKEAIKNTVIDSGKENNVQAGDNKNAITVNKEKKTTPTTTENKKENTTITKQSNKHHWFIDAGVTPLLPVQQYDANITFNRTLLSNNTLSLLSAKLVSTSIDPAVAFSVAVRRTLNKKFMVGVGLQYLLLKENITISGNETTTAYSVVQRLVNGSNGPELVDDTVATVTEGTRKINAVNSYRLYSIPVFIQYCVVQKRSWSLAAVGGMYININSSYQNEINRDAAALLTATPASTGKTTIGYDLFAGLRFSKSIGNKIEFFALPSMRWNLGQYNIKNSLLRKTIDQAGLSVGISYKMK